MPVKQISNVAGVFGTTAQADQVQIELLNNSGATLAPGDVVVVDVTGTKATTTTSAKDITAIGVVSSHGSDAATDAATYASGQPCLVTIGGVSRIQIGSNTVAALDILGTTTTAKQAGTAGTPTMGQAIAVALEASTAKDANNTIRAIIAKY